MNEKFSQPCDLRLADRRIDWRKEGRLFNLHALLLTIPRADSRANWISEVSATGRFFEVFENFRIYETYSIILPVEREFRTETTALKSHWTKVVCRCRCVQTLSSADVPAFYNKNISIQDATDAWTFPEMYRKIFYPAGYMSDVDDANPKPRIRQLKTGPIIVPCFTSSDDDFYTFVRETIRQWVQTRFKKACFPKYKPLLRLKIPAKKKGRKKGR